MLDGTVVCLGRRIGKRRSQVQARASKVASRPDSWIAEDSPKLMPRICTSRAAAADRLAYASKQ
jgi:hypothetical protein